MIMDAFFYKELDKKGTIKSTQKNLCEISPIKFLDQYNFNMHVQPRKIDILLDRFVGLSSKAICVFGDLKVEEITNQKLKKNVNEFVDMFVSLLKILDDKENIFPPMDMLVEEDNVFFSWIFNPDFKIGFTIVEDIESSSWFLFKRGSGMTGSLSGSFNEGNYREIIRWLLDAAMENT